MVWVGWTDPQVSLREGGEGDTPSNDEMVRVVWPAECSWVACKGGMRLQTTTLDDP